MKVRAFVSLWVLSVTASAQASGLPEIRLGQPRSALTPATAPLVERLRGLHQGEEALLHAVPLASGEGYRTIIGRLPALDAPIQALDDQDIHRQVIAFIDRNHDLLGLKDGIPADWLALDQVRPGEQYWTVSFKQQRDGVWLDDAALKLVFYPDGDLYSIGGQLESFASPGPFRLSARQALALASRYLGQDLRIGDSRELISRHGEAAPIPERTLPFVSDSIEMQGYFAPGIDRFTGERIWHFRSTGGEHVIVDDARAEVSDEYALVMGYDTVPCNVRHFDFPRTNGLATSVTASGSRIDQVTCGGDEILGFCYYQLRRSELTNGLDRVQDADGTEPEIVQGCSNNTPINFTETSTQGDFEEQSAFLFGTQTRAFLGQNLYNRVRPSSPTNVEYYVDCQSRLGSHYDPFWHDICIAPTDTDRLTVISHEYGHHALVTYGLNTSSTCTDDVNENETLHETLAEVLQLVYVADEGFIDMAYNGDPSDSVMRSHRSAGGGTQDGSNDCDASDIHNEGLGLSEAIWELLYNSDCSTGCTAQTGTQTDIWTTTTSQETVITNVGDALAFAFDAVPSDTTHEDVVAQMSARFVTRFGSVTAARAMAVVGHHGR